MTHPDGITLLKKRFQPASDITVYELALIVAKMLAPAGRIFFTRAQWDTVAPAFQKHFVDATDLPHENVP